MMCWGREQKSFKAFRYFVCGNLVFEFAVKHLVASRTREMYSRVPRENCWMWQIV